MNNQTPTIREVQRKNTSAEIATQEKIKAISSQDQLVQTLLTGENRSTSIVAKKSVARWMVVDEYETRSRSLGGRKRVKTVRDKAARSMQLHVKLGEAK